MSVKALNWAFEVIGAHDLSAGDKLVLLALAHRHSAKDGRCFPSRATLAEMTGIGDRSVKYALASLEGMGLIRRHSRTVNGRQRSNDYSLNLSTAICAGINPARGGKHSAPLKTPRGGQSPAPLKSASRGEAQCPQIGKSNTNTIESGNVITLTRELKAVGGGHV